VKEEDVGKTSDPDDLDSWFDEDAADDIVQLADAISDEPEETSASEEDEIESPDPQTSDDGEQSPEPETSAKTNTGGQFDWIDQLDPEFRKQAEALAHRVRSDSGRVAALTSRLDEANAALQARQKALAEGRAPEGATSSETEDTDEALSQFSEAYPTVAENVEKIVSQRVAREREQLMKEVLPLKEESIRQQALAQRTALRENARRIFNSAETGVELEDVVQSDAWKDWLGSQPAGYQQFARNANEAADASKVLEDFAAYSERRAYEEWIAKHGEPTSENSPSDADSVAARRAQAKAGATPSTRSPHARGDTPSTYEDYFDLACET